MKKEQQLMDEGEWDDNTNDDFMDVEQVQLLNKIMKLESELQGKEKENKLFAMKLKESDYSNANFFKSSMSPRRQIKSAHKYKSASYRTDSGL